MFKNKGILAVVAVVGVVAIVAVSAIAVKKNSADKNEAAD